MVFPKSKHFHPHFHDGFLYSGDEDDDMTMITMHKVFSSQLLLHSMFISQFVAMRVSPSTAFKQRYDNTIGR